MFTLMHMALVDTAAPTSKSSGPCGRKLHLVVQSRELELHAFVPLLML
jgi:hypothetical protein